MRKLLVLVLALYIVLSEASAANNPQGINGTWQGPLLITENKSMQLIVHFIANDKGYKATLDVPEQNQYGLEFNQVNVDGNEVNLALSAANINYKATLKNNVLEGTYSQGTFNAPLNLKRTSKPVARQKKPQEPENNALFRHELVTFPSLDGQHQLSGVLSYPKGSASHVAILLSGSGPTTRDADVFGHKVFTVIAKQLNELGVAVLRYDDRGVGKSTGDYASATSADFANDANAAYQFLSKHSLLSQSKIGFIGHSEGGLIGAIAGANNPQLDFLVSLAGLGTSGADILIDQSYYIQKLLGMDEQALMASDKVQREIIGAIKAGISKTALVDLMKRNGISPQQANAQTEQMTSPWFEFFIKTDAKKYLTQLRMPVLALNGELDSQVLAEKNIEGFEHALQNGRLTTKIYPRLNHLFQPAKTGLPSEYAEIDITFSATVSSDIVQWLKSLS